jgi:flagellar motor switch protein FliG
MTMKLSNDGLRKAAILVASLDTAAADAVLDQLTPEEARQVRQIVMQMDDIDQGEQRRVIDEFTAQGAGGHQVGHHAPMVVVGERGAGGHHVPMVGEQGAGSTGPGVEWIPSTPGPRPPAPCSPLPPFRFLQEAEADHVYMVPELVRVLGSERPQTIALVLSHLSPVRAGAVLARLPQNVQVDVIHRLVDLEETDPEILREVEETLRSRLTQPVEMQHRRPRVRGALAGLQAVAGILRATDGRTGMQILDNLAGSDRALAEKLRGPAGWRPLTFDDLSDLDEGVLAAVFDEAGPELMLPALFGAAPELVSRVLAPIPQADARAIRQKLDHPGPIRLSDVEEARRQVARIASRSNYRVTHGVVRAA